MMYYPQKRWIISRTDYKTSVKIDTIKGIDTIKTHPKASQ